MLNRLSVLTAFSFLAAAGVVSAPAVGAQSVADLPKVTLAPGDTLPMDPAATIGVLPNGLTYYVRANKKPEKRAEFRLVLRAGSLMEDDDQRGLAHWVEHMAFNGTKNFKENDLIRYLQSIGVQFGADLNAFTSFDRTVYILPVPTDTAAQVAQALQILEDWAHLVSFEQKDFEEERGVIIAEMRSRLGVGNRVSDKQIPVLYKGSKYVNRLPIGTKESLESATHDKIVRFYKQWYRPDLMAVIAIGDFDQQEMVKQIIAQFSNIPKAEGPAPKPKFPVPLQPGTTVLVVDDPEITSTSASMMFRRAAFATGTYAANREGLIRNFFSGMMNQRFAEITRKPGAPFLGAGVSFSGFSEDIGTASIGVGVVNNGLERGMQAALDEVARVSQNGFTQAELDRVKLGFAKSIENFYLGRGDQVSKGFADAYVEHFMSGSPVSSVEVQVSVMKQIAESITLAEINKESDFWKAKDSRLLMVQQPKKEGINQPDTAALLSLFDKVAGQTFAAYEEKVDTAPLIPNLPKAGKVVSEKQHPEVGVTEWTLSNGATVFVKKTDYSANSISFAGTSPGGSSLFPTSDYPTAAYVGSVMVGGVGRFTPVELGKRLAGKSAGASLNLGGTSEGISGGSSRKDLETMMQLVYLNFTAQRFDSVAIEAQYEKMRAGLANRSSVPAAAFQDTVTVTLSQGSKRSPLPSLAILDSINWHKAFDLFNSRFADAGDFTFMFVGDFDTDTLKTYVEQYLATLPAKKGAKREVAVDNGVRRPSGIVKKVISGGQEPKATTVISFHGPYVSSPENALAMRVMKDVLQTRLTKKLREELSGTYGVQVGTGASSKPVGLYTVDVQFVSEPSRREELTAAVFEVIDSLKKAPPSAEEVQESLEPAIRQHETAVKTNGFWFGILNLKEQGRPFADLLDLSRVTGFKAESVQAAAKAYLNPANYAQFDLIPVTQGAPSTPAATPAQ